MNKNQKSSPIKTKKGGRGRLAYQRKGLEPTWDKVKMPHKELIVIKNKVLRMPIKWNSSDPKETLIKNFRIDSIAYNAMTNVS